MALPSRINLVLPESLFVTLERFHDMQRRQDGSETISIRTLEQMAKDGKLPGAFRPKGSRIWWVNLLHLLQNGNEAIKEDAEEEEGGESEEGGRKRRDQRNRLPRKKAEEWPGAVWPGKGDERAGEG